MKPRKNNGLAGIDTIIAIIAVTIFSTLIISLIYNNVFENVKLKNETLAMIYITEIFENIGIQNYQILEIGDYNDIGKNNYNDNIKNLVPQDATKRYKVDMQITQKEEDIKEIIVTLNYNLNNKNYTCSMKRMKIKE